METQSVFMDVKTALEDIIRRTPTQERVAHDPVGIVHGYAQAEQEVVAHIAAVLAYGRVSAIRDAVSRVLQVLGPSPTAWVRDAHRGDFKRLEPDFVYRMTRADDIDAFLSALGAILRAYGTLENAFVSFWTPSAPDLTQALAGYVRLIREQGGSNARGFHYLTPDPSKGGATKRWYLMLRWLVRPQDGVDLGLWTRIPPRQLLLPVDRHIEQLVRHLGWSDRASADLIFVRQATDQLRLLDPVDPLRYDFALCHMGISGDCAHHWDPAICMACPLRPFCVEVPPSFRK